MASGDYKTESDGLCEDFELVPCHKFITESTFGLPIFKWEKEASVLAEINDWWAQNRKDGICSIISAYSLGKAQRILHGVNDEIGEIYCHGAVENINEVFRNQGAKLTATKRVTKEMKKADFAGKLIIAPPSAINSAWSKKLGPTSVGMASGWMRLRGARRRRGADRGFILSDHADWDGLNKVIKETKAEKVFVTHGYIDSFSKWLNETGIPAEIVQTNFQGEQVEGEQVDEEQAEASKETKEEISDDQNKQK